jgi:hypothetical protein
VNGATTRTRADRKARVLLIEAMTSAICMALFREAHMGPCLYPKCLCLRVPLEVAEAVDKMLENS